LLRELGADHVVAVEDGKFADQVLDLTAGRGADVIVDHVGGPYLEETIRSAAIKGRVVGVGRLGGATGSLDMEALAFKRLEIVGVTFRTRSSQEKAELVQAMVADLAPVIARGALKARIDSVLPWTDALVAQALVAEDRQLGKVVLTVG
jgi:NADPH2:quinone reductase